MQPLVLHAFHQSLGASWAEVNGQEVVEHYGDTAREYSALQESAGLLDLSFRGRLCLAGADRQAFLHGQVTNEVKALSPGQGCYAALITAKGKMLSDLNIYCLAEELLLDFEPGLTQANLERLDKYIIASEVQIVEVAPFYGLLSVQGPRAAEVIGSLKLFSMLPDRPFEFVSRMDSTGELYLMNQPRIGSIGFDLFVPQAAMESMAERLASAVRQMGGSAAGWRALEASRIRAGIPRFGADMDENNLPPEAGLENRAISYSKGCYIGQEVIARLRTYGQVAKALRGLRLADDLPGLPRRGDKLHLAGKEVGYLTSATTVPGTEEKLAMGYVRREANQPGKELVLRTEWGESLVKVVELPF